MEKYEQRKGDQVQVMVVEQFEKSL